MSTGSIPVSAYTRARNAINSLIVQQLKAVLRAENQPVSGTKSILVNRLEKRMLSSSEEDYMIANPNLLDLEGYYSRNDVTKFQILSDLITEPAGGIAIQPAANSTISYSNHPHTGSYGTPSSWHTHANGHGMGQYLTSQAYAFHSADNFSSSAEL